MLGFKQINYYLNENQVMNILTNILNYYQEEKTLLISFKFDY